MTRQEIAAAKIQARHAVDVEWAPANHEYVVDGICCKTAREAAQVARKVSVALDKAAAGNDGPYRDLHQ